MKYRPYEAPLWLIVAVLGSLSCSPSDGPQTGTQTNWLKSCSDDSVCPDAQQCLCGMCTLEVNDEPEQCDALTDAIYAPADDASVIALCGGIAPDVPGMCVLDCEDAACPEGSSCVAGVCAPTRETTLEIELTPGERFQSLIGFGAAIAFVEGELNDHPQKDEIYDVMFSESGIDAMRLRNVLVNENAELVETVELMNAAEERLNHLPVIVLSSSSPPAALKANGSTLCEGNWDTCTLARNDAGEFDYAGFAQYWHDSLDEYLSAGLAPDFISIQNDSNWVPPAGAPLETCRFLPVQGTTNVTIDDTELEVEYPGYAEALREVQESFSDLSYTAAFVGPETTSVQATVDFVNEMGTMNLAGIAHHMYGTPEEDSYSSLAELSRQESLPLLQTEMAAEGIETAQLMQEALVDVGSSMYLQTDFVTSAGRTTPDENALISLTETTYTVNDPYYTLQHFSRDTEPGFTRIGAQSTLDAVRVSAWMSPDEDKVTLVLVNPETTAETASVDFGDFVPATITGRRTVFAGTERYADLGRLETEAETELTLDLPAQSIITLVLEQ